MAKKSKKRRTAKPSPAPRPSHDREPTNSAEVATVAWMLSLLATLIAQVLGIVIRVTTIRLGVSDRLQVLSGTLLIVALVAGVATLVLTPVTIKLRRAPPPRPIVVSAIIAGIIPILTVLILSLR